MPSFDDPVSRQPQPRFVNPLRIDRRDHNYPERMHLHDESPSFSLALTQELLRLRKASGDPTVAPLEHLVALRRKDPGPQHKTDFGRGYVTDAEVQTALHNRQEVAAEEHRNTERWRLLSKAPGNGHLHSLLNEMVQGRDPAVPGVKEAQSSVTSAIQLGRLKANLADRNASQTELARLESRLCQEYRGYPYTTPRLATTEFDSPLCQFIRGRGV